MSRRKSCHPATSKPPSHLPEQPRIRTTDRLHLPLPVHANPQPPKQIALDTNRITITPPSIVSGVLIGMTLGRAEFPVFGRSAMKGAKRPASGKWTA